MAESQEKKSKNTPQSGEEIVRGYVRAHRKGVRKKCSQLRLSTGAAVQNRNRASSGNDLSKEEQISRRFFSVEAEKVGIIWMPG